MWNSGMTMGEICDEFCKWCEEVCKLYEEV